MIGYLCGMKRPWLFPFIPLYAIAVWLRNRAFDRGILRSTQFEIPCVVIGNLNVGGTGKTPHTKWLLDLMKEYRCGVLSRGYGRKTRGFRWVSEQDSADLCGDEPLMLKRQLPHVAVAVAEDRVLGVAEMLADDPDLDLIVLDDAYQHRYLKPHLSLLLTAFDDLYADDRLLPAGNLREQKSGRKRADYLVITRIPERLSKADKLMLATKLGWLQKPLFFSRVLSKQVRDTRHHLIDLSMLSDYRVIFFSAIAGGDKWTLAWRDRFKRVERSFIFSDHYAFKRADIEALKEALHNCERPCLMLTTEKDLMRLEPYLGELSTLPICYAPIEVEIEGPTASLKRQLEALIEQYRDYRGNNLIMND